MSSSEAFTLISESKHAGPQLFDSYLDGTSGKLSDLDVHLANDLRKQYPELIVTVVPSNNANFLYFADAGYAIAELDNTPDDPVIRWRGYLPPAHRGGDDALGEARFFAKYRYVWNDEQFILYVVTIGYGSIQYMLKEPRDGETTLDNSAVTDSLIYSIGRWMNADEDVVYVFDGYWYPSKQLWQQVQEATWDKVILDPNQKKALTDVSSKFFDSKDIYEEYGVPWKRGLIFHGPVGNGKTISIKALMHTLYERKPKIPSLYVKAAPNTFNIAQVFTFARRMTPCLLILEDIETIVTSDTRSYFFNEVDGLENNDGILMVATTNYLDRLDPGLSKRPSRFDRKYLFPRPDLDQRTAYCEFWRNKLKSKPNIEFPKKLCKAIAKLTDDFSFAYLQEAFIATLLVLARGKDPDQLQSDDNDDKDDDDLDSYDLYRVMKEQIKILRRDMGSDDDGGQSRDSTLSIRTAVAQPSRMMYAQREAALRNSLSREAAFSCASGTPGTGTGLFRTSASKGATEGMVRPDHWAAGRHQPAGATVGDLNAALQGMMKTRNMKDSAFAWIPKA